MKVFHCDHCNQPVFFENTTCLACGHVLAYLPDLREIGSLERDGDRWTSPLPSAAGRSYRLCRNYTEADVCNWAITDDDDAEALCQACRLTRVIPDLSLAGRKEDWYRIEVAKRRLVYSLTGLGLPVVDRSRDPDGGLAFEFLADTINGIGGSHTPVLTGHENGVIRINIAEADDAERERRRHALGEPYRTLLGHLRHESGHYYWTHLVQNTNRLDAFRELFGDERQDYAGALDTYYQQGPRLDWQKHFISAYSTAHAWEDWAETWAHYLHIVDTLETASACGLALKPARRDEPSFSSVPAPEHGRGAFDRMITSWFPVTYILNSLNRGMGLSDGYPFVLSPDAIDKLRFVHDVVAPEPATAAPAPATPGPSAVS